MQTALASGERLLWQGAPADGVRFSPQDIFAIPFTLVWLMVVTGIFIAALTGGMQGSVDPMFWLVLPLFAAIGLYMLVGRFVVDGITRRRTGYMLTDRRAIIESGLLRSSVRSVSLAAVAEIRIRENRKGRGTIQFGSGSGPFAMMPRNWPGAGQFASPAFDGIDDARQVYEMAIKAQQQAQGGRD